jgi:hypothetical protein
MHLLLLLLPGAVCIVFMVLRDPSIRAMTLAAAGRASGYRRWRRPTAESPFMRRLRGLPLHRLLLLVPGAIALTLMLTRDPSRARARRAPRPRPAAARPFPHPVPPHLLEKQRDMLERMERIDRLRRLGPGRRREPGVPPGAPAGHPPDPPAVGPMP